MTRRSNSPYWAAAFGMLILLLPLAGCMPPGTTAFHVTEQSWSAPLSPLRGRFYTTTIGLTTQRCVIWTDIPKNTAHARATGYKCSGSHVATDGTKVDWLCKTKDGRTFSEITIDSKAYQLQQGRVFLISVRDGQVIVLQLDVDPCPSPRTDPSGGAAMRQLAESDERVISFFQGDADGKTP